MLEISYGLTFFLKSPKRKSDLFRYVYVRITVDGVPKETSTKRRWDVRRWDQKIERAIGTKEDAKSLNFFLDSLEVKVSNFKTELVNTGKTITAERIIDFVKGHETSKAKVLEEFQKHNDEVKALIPEQYSKGTHTRYVTARSHVADFIMFKYKKVDIEFRELNYEFVADYEFYLKTVRKCANNTVLKYISNFKKIVLLAVAKEIIPNDPFKLFQPKWTKLKKRPLTTGELHAIENKKFESARLSTIRDIFVFQCYTGLAFIDAFQLKKTDIKEGNDGKLWIMSSRQKSKSTTDIPLLSKPIEIINKYKNDPLCISRGSILPVKSNQKMNEYLKEIATLCGITTSLNTHKARRTFASTVTLNNGVPIYVVKSMLGHHSIKQTEDYAITEQETVSREMMELQERLFVSAASKIESKDDVTGLLNRLDKDLEDLNSAQQADDNAALLRHFSQELDDLKSVQQTTEQNIFKKKLVQFAVRFNKFRMGLG